MVTHSLDHCTDGSRDMATIFKVFTWEKGVSTVMAVRHVPTGYPEWGYVHASAFCPVCGAAGESSNDAELACSRCGYLWVVDPMVGRD